MLYARHFHRFFLAWHNSIIDISQSFRFGLIPWSTNDSVPHTIVRRIADRRHAQIKMHCDIMLRRLSAFLTSANQTPDYISRTFVYEDKMLIRGNNEIRRYFKSWLRQWEKKKYDIYATVNDLFGINVSQIRELDANLCTNCQEPNANQLRSDREESVSCMPLQRGHDYQRMPQQT